MQHRALIYSRDPPKKRPCPPGSAEKRPSNIYRHVATKLARLKLRKILLGLDRALRHRAKTGALQTSGSRWRGRETLSLPNSPILQDSWNAASRATWTRKGPGGALPGPGRPPSGSGPPRIVFDAPTNVDSAPGRSRHSISSSRNGGLQIPGMAIVSRIYRHDLDKACEWRPSEKETPDKALWKNHHFGKRTKH